MSRTNILINRNILMILRSLIEKRKREAGRNKKNKKIVALKSKSYLF